MRSKRNRNFIESSDYELSISDLMAALCCIFCLVMVAVTVSLQSTKKQLNRLSSIYVESQADLFETFEKEFKSDLKNWNATIDSKGMFIRFSKFGDYSPELTTEIKFRLDDFFPRFVNIVLSDKFKDKIEEIRIEGYTAPDPLVPFTEEDYRDGLDLSYKRTKNVLDYCLNTGYYSDLNDEDKDWIRTHFVFVGYSYTKPLNRNGIVLKPRIENTFLIDKALTRRVEFKIKTNSEDVVHKIMQDTSE